MKKIELSHFISHYVQIKRSKEGKYVYSLPVFISHYVQIKHEPVFLRTANMPFFISHYVQIKLSILEKASSASLTLYPTTFR